MLDEWTLEHFKSVYERTTLPLAPLTIFAGPNSAGKSTVMQSLLLATQTIQNPVSSRTLVLNGHITKLGSFQDVLSNGIPKGSRTISLGFQIRPAPGVSERVGATTGRYWAHGRASIERIRCEFQFSSSSELDIDESLRVQAMLDECRMKVDGLGEGQTIEEDLVIRRSNTSQRDRLQELRVPRDTADPAMLASLTYEVTRPVNTQYLRRIFRLRRAGRPAGASFSHFLPVGLTVVFDSVEEEARALVDTLTAPEYAPPDFDVIPELRDGLQRARHIIVETIESSFSAGPVQELFPHPSKNLVDELKADFSPQVLRRLYSRMGRTQRAAILAQLNERSEELKAAAIGGRPPNYVLAPVPLSDLMGSGVDHVRHHFTRMVKYLGPLRDEPKPVYPLAGGTDPTEVGYKGEYTAAVLELHRNASVEYYPSSAFSSAGGGSAIGTTLRAAVMDWLDYMGIADDVRTEDKGKLGHAISIAVSEGEELHDLTHVGVGVSQVLPILVLSLIAEPGSTLIFEQPELHLHPRVQTRLADFFVSLTRLGKQCLVETHSEYLVNRLRFRAAIADDDEISKSTILYFVSRLRGRSVFKPIRINEFGVIGDWPSGFFDESDELSRSILEAGTEKRRRLAKARRPPR